MTDADATAPTHLPHGGASAPLGLDLRAMRLTGLTADSDPIRDDAATPATPKPRKLDRDHARALNVLMRRRAPVNLRVGTRSVALHLRPETHAPDGAPWLSLTLDGAPGAIAIPWPVLRRLAGQPLDAATPADAALLLEDALTPWLDAAEQLTGLSLRFDRLDRSVPDPAPDLALILGVETLTPQRGRQPLALRLSPRAVPRLAEAVARWARPRDQMPGLVLRAAIELDSLSLPLSDLRGLRPGDALMLPQDAAARPAWVVVEGRLAAPVAPHGDGLWRMTAPFARRAPPAPRAPHFPPLTETPAMTDPHQPPPDAPSTDAPPAEPPPADAPSAPPAAQAAADPTAAQPAPALAALDDLELRVSFRLGEALMPLAELREAGVGTVIALDRPDGAPVDLILNGQVIGTGQITSIAGQRACEIITLFGDG